MEFPTSFEWGILSVSIPSTLFCGKADFGYKNNENLESKSIKLFSVICAY